MWSDVENVKYDNLKHVVYGRQRRTARAFAQLVPDGMSDCRQGCDENPLRLFERHRIRTRLALSFWPNEAN
jgi:hypothetical protein